MSFLEDSSGFDLMQTDVRFPVVESASLTPVPGRLFRTPRRRSDDLPELVGGSVHVFQTNEQFAVAPSGPKMLMSEVVVKATMVAVVLTRAQVVPAVAILPSINPEYRLALRASYNCKVHNPVQVLTAGCWDVRPELLEYLLGDPKLRMLGARDDVVRNPEVSQRILARTIARNELEPPDIPGMRVRLVDVTLAIHHDGGWTVGQPQSAEQSEPYDPGTRDLFGDGHGNGRPRDGYGTYSPDGDERE
ncbi:hypothetical protein [Phytohabitans houttuyneae]|uniref:hypothetical protein n=1 Tax=Phytohabitans houttuyneae TaxID=1076126 RepID=UPI0015646A8E|nr:hypothetical protein [Phytohabitans houttuyneae]